LCAAASSAINGDAMTPNRLDRLTEQQRICLRHVYAHKTSKEIAPLLGIEPGSVDQHIKAAMKTLGVTERRTAARLLAEHEDFSTEPAPAPPTPIQPLVYQSPDIAPMLDPATMGGPIESGPQRHFGLPGHTMREEQAGFSFVRPGGAPTLPLPIGNSRPSDLNWALRLVWIVAIAIGVAVAFGGLVSGVEALVRLIRH
jgi:DNA-binding CsgD family transcriptional regulator